MATTWEARDPDTGEADPALLDANVTDAVNRFAREAQIEFHDPGTDKPDEYSDYTLVDLYARERRGESFERRWAGFVVEQKWESDTATIDLLSHDHWLKRRKVYRSYEDEDPIDLLEDLITTFTPLIWDADLVELVDPPGEITQTYKGETPSEIVGNIVDASDQEQFGATNDREFFVQERNPTEAPVTFTPGRYVSTDWDDDSRGETNQVTVRYGENGDQAVSVDDKGAQQALADEIGSDTPVVLEKSKTYEGIEDAATARTKAESILRKGDPIQVGEIKTYGATGLTPGDVVTVVDPETGIDGEFRVAEIEYKWRDDETTTVVAENREGVEDVIAGLSEEVDRVEARPAATDPEVREYIELDVIGEMGFALTVREQMFSADILRFGDVGAPIGAEGVGESLGDGLEDRAVRVDQ